MTNRIYRDPVENVRWVVQRAHLGARVEPDGGLFVVRAGGRTLSRARSTPERAWADAYRLAKANGELPA